MNMSIKRSTDKKIGDLIKKENKRQKTTLQMIPSENFTSQEVIHAVGSILINKYSEGYPGKRYYQGNENYDEIESVAIERAKKLFKVVHVNVQPYSGSPANSAVFFALLNIKDKILGMSLPFGGHLTHGHPLITLSGKYFNSIQYKTDKNGYIDYEDIEKIALIHKPKLIISGTSSYPRKINFKKFGEIADKVGAYHLADISHIAGLVAAESHQSPVNYAHIVTTTTHKTLRGPRGAMIMATKKGIKKDPKLPEKIDKAVFPGLQGGPHNNTTAGIAIALKEASGAEFKKYANQIIKNCNVLADELIDKGYKLSTNGTDNHLILIDVSDKGIDGWYAAWALEYAGIIVNRNTIPFDKRSPFYPSGIRLGTPAVTTLGMKEKDMIKISGFVDDALKRCSHIVNNSNSMSRSGIKNKLKNDVELKDISKKVRKLCKIFV
jgi:glycine hydroxymethyltransferase